MLFRSGRGLDPTWSMDLERQRYDWLKSHIDGLVTAVRSCPKPGQPTLGSTSSIFEKATSAELYCCHCQRFAENMTKLAVVLRDLPQRTQQVSTPGGLVVKSQLNPFIIS